MFLIVWGIFLKWFERRPHLPSVLNLHRRPHGHHGEWKLNYRSGCDKFAISTPEPFLARRKLQFKKKLGLLRPFLRNSVWKPLSLKNALEPRHGLPGSQLLATVKVNSSAIGRMKSNQKPFESDGCVESENGAIWSTIGIWRIVTVSNMIANSTFGNPF